MKTFSFTLALTTLATLATACDPATTGAPSDASTFRDDVIVPPTTTGGTVLVGKGGHDLPTEIVLGGYDRASLEIQLGFLAQIEKQIILALEADFLANEGNYAECPWICDGLNMSWDEGVFITGLRFEISQVSLAEDAEGLHWETEARGDAQVGCGCF
jgi:hypothetical protein